MATSAHSFSPGKVWFQPLKNIQRNIGESLLTVCVPPTGHLILTGGEKHLALNFAKHLHLRHCQSNQSLGRSIWQVAKEYTCWICNFEDDMDIPE